MTERQQFEKWISTRKLCTKYGAKMDRLTDGQYRDVRVRGNFVTWQAARASLSLKIPQSCACSREITTGWTADNGIPLCNVCGRVDVSAAFEMAKEPPKVPQGVEEWIAEHGLQFVDTLGGYGEKLKRSSELKYPCPEYVSVDDLSELLSGMAIVPVETQKDAERYRFIRNKIGYDRYGVTLPCGNTKSRPEETDAAIDAAMLAATKEKGEGDMNDYDEFKIWYTQKAPDESEVTMVDMAAMAWQAARATAPEGMAIVPVDVLDDVVNLAGYSVTHTEFNSSLRRSFIKCCDLLAATKEKGDRK